MALATEGYSHRKAALTVELAELAYNRNGWDATIDRLSVLGFDHAELIENQETDTQVLIVWDSADMIVCWRGTDSKTDWRTNFNISQFKTEVECVHDGFYSAMMSLFGNVDIALREIKSRYALPSPRLTVTGHSLGAALAGMFAYYYDQVTPVYEVWMHASPRWAGRLTSKVFDKTFKGRAWRTEHNNDIVCRVPFRITWTPKGWAIYRHVKSLVYITEKGRVKTKVRGIFKFFDRLWGKMRNFRDWRRKDTKTRRLDMIDDHHTAYYYDAFAAACGEVRDWEIWEGFKKDGANEQT